MDKFYALSWLEFGVIAAYFLLAKYRAHFFGALPFLLILTHPQMHVFMHRGHGGHGGDHAHHHDRQQSSNPAAAPQPGKTGEQP